MCRHAVSNNGFFRRSVLLKLTKRAVLPSLAWAELYLTVAMLASQFDFEFAGGTGPEDVEWLNDRFILGVKGKNGIRVLVSKRQA